ncbi:MAG: putative peptidoglycan glycosyltransferase FtsW [Candidatus Peribacteraceae bacterium]|nr:putative peptidoglycan glycosyltransferase FtsW [Candidatus Peribacteraceae bacterium]
MFRRIDLLLLGLTVVLTLFGLAMIASVSVFESYQLTLRLTEQGTMNAPTNAFYLLRSFKHVLIGFSVLGITTLIPYHFWERHARTFYFLSLLLLIAVFIPGLNAGWGTSNSWLRIGPLSLQPSELFKLAFIFYLAVWLQKREQLIGTLKEGFVPFATLLVVSTFIIAAEPDFGTFLILCGIASVMFFIAGGNIFHLLLGGGLAGALGIPIILQKEYIRARFMAFLLPNDPRIAETIGFQIKQALIAIGSGGAFGVGYGKSIQKFGYLPEVQADMVFAAMAEELGFLRLLIVLGMYVMLIERGFRIARNAPDRFGFLVAAGISSWIGVQTAVNIAVNLGIFPLTGLTLPFISYGGSSLLALLASIGILLNISMHSTEEAALARRERKRTASPVLRLFS